MFKTMREAEALAGLTRVSGESQFWPFVEIQTILPWFHIQTIESVGNTFHKGVILAVSVDQLKQFLQHDCQNAWIDEVQVISPGKLNGTSSWKMEVLVKLTEFYDHDGFPLGHAYEVRGGAAYSTVIADPSKTTHSNVVFVHNT